MIPGNNLLNSALRIINKQQVAWYKFMGRSLNAIGNDIPVYADPVMIDGSFQPADNRLIQNLGLNLEEEYYVFYTSNKLTDLIRGSSGDQVVFNFAQYQVESITDWHAIDGWVRAVCRFVGPSTL